VTVLTQWTAESPAAHQSHHKERNMIPSTSFLNPLQRDLAPLIDQHGFDEVMLRWPARRIGVSSRCCSRNSTARSSGC
jgi:hypothetical protein